MCYNYIRYNEIAVKSYFIAVFSDFSGGRFKLKKLSRYIKILALALSAVLTLCACSGDGASSGESSSAPDYSLDTSAKVGYVYNEEISRDNMTFMFEKSRKDIETALGLETCYVDGVAVSQFENAVKALKNEGCSIIVSASHVFANSALSYAKKDKDVYILSYGGTASLTNLTTFRPKLYQPAFICGTVAAWNSSSHKIGIVADDLMYCSNGVINAFILGIQQIYKERETDVEIIYAETKAQTETAVNTLEGKGCDVIFSYQSNDYCMYYCDSIGMRSIGFTNDMAYSAPKYGLVGYYLNWATFITDTVRTCINDNFMAEVYVGGFSEAFVKLTPYSAACKKETLTIADTLYDYVKKGKAKIFEGEIRDKDGLARVGAGATLDDMQVLAMDYLVYGVTYIDNIIDPVPNPTTSDLIVKEEYVS